MINIEFAFNLILGLSVLLIVLALFLLRVIKYELSRDFDIFLASLGLGYGVILIFNGWRLDPILALSQVLIILIFSAVIWENFRLRGRIFSIENKQIIDTFLDVDEFLNVEESSNLAQRKKLDESLNVDASLNLAQCKKLDEVLNVEESSNLAQRKKFDDFFSFHDFFTFQELLSLKNNLVKYFFGKHFFITFVTLILVLLLVLIIKLSL